jgi:hypothetical protein
MSFPTTGPLPPDAPTSVFVDESGRRRARTRIVARFLVAGAFIYVFVVIAGLTGSVSLPGVHLGELKRAAPGDARASALGPGSKVVSLPAALKPRGSKIAAPAATLSGSPGVAPGATSPTTAGSGASVAGTGPTPTTQPGATTTLPTTTLPGPATTSTPPATTTSRPRGRSTTTTTTPHGPPSTLPGQGNGRTKL